MMLKSSYNGGGTKSQANMEQFFKIDLKIMLTTLTGKGCSLGTIFSRGTPNRRYLIKYTTDL
jgi:hypothetical protein